MPKNTFIADCCSTVLETDYTAKELMGATMDCPKCGGLIIFVVETVRGRKFHEVMNERNPEWPADGAGTGYIEVGN